MRLPALLAVWACAPLRYAPRAAAARADCGFGPDDRFEVAAADARLPSEACVHAIADDFGADLDAFAAADGLPDPYGLVRGDPGAHLTRLGLLLLNARALLLADLPDPAELRPNAVLTRAFLRQLEDVQRDTGGRDAADLMYDFTAEVILRATPGDKPEARASFHPTRRALRISRGVEDPVVVGTLLVHESRHHWEAHGACPWDPAESCDPDAAGAYGFGLAAKALVLPTLDDEAAAAHVEAGMERLLHRIAAFSDGSGHLRPEIAALHLGAIGRP